MEPALLKEITEELNETIRHGVISKIHQSEVKIIILKVFTRGRVCELLISVDPRLSRMHLTEKKYPNPERPLRFCAYLRSALTGAIIEEVTVRRNERIATIKLRKKTDEGTRLFNLIIELTGKSSNIILTDDNSIVLDALKYFPSESSARAVSPGLELKPLPEREAKEDILIEKKASSWNESADLYYSEIFVNKEKQRLANELPRTVKRAEKKLQRKIENLEADIKKAERNIENSLSAELLVANFKELKRGMKEIELEDYIESPTKKVLIKLDQRLATKENIDRLYKLAKKSRTTIKLTKGRMPKVRNDLEYTRGLYFSIDEAVDIDGLGLVMDEMREAGLLKKKGMEKRSPKKAEKKGEPIERIETENKTIILIGKNGLGNDLIVRKYAKANDLWFHALGAPGAHVLLKGKDADEASIAQAARYAAKRSKAGAGKKVEVIMAKGSDVKKPKGAKPGMVTVIKYKTILIETDDEPA